MQTKAEIVYNSHSTLSSTNYLDYIIQIYSGITRGRVLNGELYTQRLQKLIYLYLFTDCFMKISLHSSEQISEILFISQICSKDWREMYMKQSAKKYR